MKALVKQTGRHRRHRTYMPQRLDFYALQAGVSADILAKFYDNFYLLSLNDLMSWPRSSWHWQNERLLLSHRIAPN